MIQLPKAPLSDLIEKHPYIIDFFSQLGLENLDMSKNCEDIISELSEDFLEDRALEKSFILKSLTSFIKEMSVFDANSKNLIDSITIIGGEDKKGCKENLTLTLKSGEIICIVGPTGSGKSRLLGDIECLAQGDTPSKRKILVNGQPPSEENRFLMQGRLVAQLSQNMNFVMDLTVEEFITMHAESRMIENIECIVADIINCANTLAGEKFTHCTPVTQLSGGQSRALMIADTALLSASPIVLIDEIENAGVDRKKALELLVKKEKIVLLSTHDPILALMGNLRLVIKNGGISKVIETSLEEKANLQVLEKFDYKMLTLRNQLRRGASIDFDISEFLST